MKPAFAAALLFAVSPAVLGQAQVGGSDEQVYAMYVAALEKCEVAVPEGKPDYARVRKSLGQLMQKNPKLAVVLKSPTLKDTLVEARAAVDNYIARNGKEIVCGQLKEGQFGPMVIPVGP